MFHIQNVGWPKIIPFSIRSLAFYEISKLIPQFNVLSLIEICMIYIMSCCDINCTKIVAPFIRKGMACVKPIVFYGI